METFGANCQHQTTDDDGTGGQSWTTQAVKQNDNYMSMSEVTIQATPGSL